MRSFDKTKKYVLQAEQKMEGGVVADFTPDREVIMAARSDHEIPRLNDTLGKNLGRNFLFSNSITYHYPDPVNAEGLNFLLYKLTNDKNPAQIVNQFVAPPYNLLSNIVEFGSLETLDNLWLLIKSLIAKVSKDEDIEIYRSWMIQTSLQFLVRRDLSQSESQEIKKIIIENYGAIKDKKRKGNLESLAAELGMKEVFSNSVSTPTKLSEREDDWGEEKLHNLYFRKQ